MRGLLREAVIENASALVREARLLLDHGSPARALVLSVTAREELAKADYLDRLGDDGTPDAKSKEWRNHRVKAMLATLANVDLALPDSWPDDLEEQLALAITGYEAVRVDAASDVERRMAGLYVDFAGGTIMRPSDISEEEARGVIDDAARLLKRLA